jgi:hypothetical protein
MHICDELSQFGICTLASLLPGQVSAKSIPHLVKTKIQAYDDLVVLSEGQGASSSQ